MRKTILVFSSIIIAVLLLFQLSKYSLISGSFTLEFLLVLIASCFFAIGFFIFKKFYENKNSVEIDHSKIKDLEITEREYQVLQLISKGFSNKEIGDQLFISESTIKTHVSNLLLKLNAKRRTQAIEIAKKFNIL